MKDLLYRTTCLWVVLLGVCYLLPAETYAQEIPTTDSLISKITTDSVCVQRDLGDELAKWLGKTKKQKPEKNSSLLLVPVLASNPATGFQLGVAGQYVFRD